MNRFGQSWRSLSPPAANGRLDLGTIQELNGRPTAQERLIEAIGRLREQDAPEHRQQLRQAYADLPAYCRKYIFGSRMEQRKDIQQPTWKGCIRLGTDHYYFK